MTAIIIISCLVFALNVLFACLPPKRAYVAAKCFKIVASAFSIGKVCDALVAYYKSKKK
ncbi:hypothetical protein [Flavobacterium soyae]|uniref:Uncharacterized protein n=1 Tax=Flavobacterium soyae TaxID=2903098 RepID=A0ABZ2UK16_9FLAO